MNPRAAARGETEYSILLAMKLFLLFCFLPALFTALQAQPSGLFDELDFYEEASAHTASPAEWSERVAILTREINLNPNLAAPYIARGKAKSMLGDARGAREDLNRAIDLNPESAQHYAARAEAGLRLGDYTGAVADLTAAIDRDPHMKGLLMRRAYAKKQLADHRGAAADFEAERRARPEDEGVFLTGMENYFAGNYAEAVASFDETVSLNADRPAYYYYRGRAAARLNDHEAAAADFRRVTDAYPRHISAVVQRGLSEIASGDLDAGCLTLSRAGDLGYARAFELIRALCN